jgi:voltage-gated potassium channel Kch
MATRAWRITRRAFNRIWFVIILMVLVHLSASVLYSVFEGASFGDGLWWATVTGTTTGYGDLYPVTNAGRLMAAIYMFAMLILSSFVIGHIASAVIEDKNLFSHNEQERLEATMLLIGIKLGVFNKSFTELPPLAWFEDQGLTPDKPGEDQEEDFV